MEKQFTLRIDFVDGMTWTEACDNLPICNMEYSTYPLSVFVSIPCKVVTEDKRIVYAVYVIATSVAHNNDGTHTKWDGWAEKTGEADDYSCVENVLNGKTIKVIRWHYYKQQEKA